MDYIAVIGIAVGLAMDAFAVSMAKAASIKGSKVFSFIKMAFLFGLFQFLMPVIGWTIGKAGENLINSVDHWIALILLGYIGIKMIYESIKKSNINEMYETNNLDLKTLSILAVATSIDALATGIILPHAVGATSVLLMFIATGLIGVITFFICLLGIYIGKKFGTLLSSKAEIAGGCVLIFIGIKIFLEHLL